MASDRKILDAAAELFHEKGFHGTSVDELGNRAGLSGPAIYRHFAGKNEVLAALFNLAMDELLAAAPSARPAADPHADLDRLIRHHVTFTLEHRHLVNVYQRESRSLVAPWRESFDKRRKDYVDRWERLLAHCFPGAPQQEVVIATQACLGMIFSITSWPSGLVREVEAADVVVRLARASLQPLAQGRPASGTSPTS